MGIFEGMDDEGTRGGAPDAPRPARVRKLTARAMEARQMDENDEAPQNAEIKKHDKTLLNLLQQVLSQQQQLHADYQREIKEIRDELKATRDQLKATQDEVKVLHNWIKENAPAWTSPSTASTASSPNLSNSTWPSLPTSNPSNPTQRTISPNSSASQQDKKPLPSVGIDLLKLPYKDEDASTLKHRFNTAFKACPATKEAKCTGILKTPGDSTKVKLLFKSQEEVDCVRTNEDWFKVHFRGARLQGEQWYPIKVDRVNRMAISEGNGWTIRDTAAKEVGEENNVSVAKMRWLSAPSEKAYGSLVVYLVKYSDAQDLLERQLMDFKGEAGFTGVFERRMVPSRCFKCQKYGHQEFRCQGEEICGKCASPGHRELNCTSPTVKCAPCGGPHKASDRGCRTYKDLLSRMNPIRNE